MLVGEPQQVLLLVLRQLIPIKKVHFVNLLDGILMGSSGSSSSKTKSYVRYAPYVEEKHESFLDTVSAYRGLIIADSPYVGQVTLPCDVAFIGSGYTLANFPSLYDMFGKFLAGLDVEVIFNYIYDEQLNLSEINSSVSAEMTLADQAIVHKDIPDFKLAMRDINTVNSSSFIIGKTQVEDARTKVFATVSSSTRFNMIPLVVDRLNHYKNWQIKTVQQYAEIIKAYFLVKMDVDSANYLFDTREVLWPFTVFDFERAALGALQGARYLKQELQRERSNLSKGFLIASYTVQGAMLGGQIYGWPGAIVGAAIGFVIGVAIVLFE